MSNLHSAVMAGLVHAIHVCPSLLSQHAGEGKAGGKKDADARDNPRIKSGDRHEVER
jgi:hypothetical protein